MIILTQSKPSHHIMVINGVEHGPFNTEIELVQYAKSIGHVFKNMDYEVIPETRQFHATTKWTKSSR